MAGPDDDATNAMAFRRLVRDPLALDALDLYSRVSQRSGSPINAGERIDDAFHSLAARVRGVAAASSRLHGWRIQTLFEAVVASLGRVKLLKLEDAGDVFFAGPDLKPADFRIVTREGRQVLVEVKSHHPKVPMAPIVLRTRELEMLQQYAEVVGKADLLFAVYWSPWNLWTLTDLESFTEVRPGRHELALPDAMMRNEMSELGDRFPGTEWPLAFTVRPAPGSVTETDGGVTFTIGSVQVAVAGRPITWPAEQAIAFRLMLHGGWPEETAIERYDNGELAGVVFSYAPQALPPKPPAFHGPLSSIFSTMFNDATLDEDGAITRLRVNIDPASLARLLPDDFEGETLRVWRMAAKPSSRMDESDDAGPWSI